MNLNDNSYKHFKSNNDDSRGSNWIEDGSCGDSNKSGDYHNESYRSYRWSNESRGHWNGNKGNSGRSDKKETNVMEMRLVVDVLCVCVVLVTRKKPKVQNATEA